MTGHHGCFGSHIEDKAIADEIDRQLHEKELAREQLDKDVAARISHYFEDLKAFEELMYDEYEAGRTIIREWLRALYIQRYNSHLPDSPNYAMDALSNCNEQLDAFIRKIVEDEH